MLSLVLLNNESLIDSLEVSSMLSSELVVLLREVPDSEFIVFSKSLSYVWIAFEESVFFVSSVYSILFKATFFWLFSTFELPSSERISA